MIKDWIHQKYKKSSFYASINMASKYITQKTKQEERAILELKVGVKQFPQY